MSDSTPDRLREFRAQYRDKAGRRKGLSVVRFIVLVAVLLLGLWGAEVFLRGAIARTSNQAGGMSPEQWRAYAVYLEGKDLPYEALHAYERYLEVAVLSDSERAKICYAMGSLAAGLGSYEKALASLYQAELLAPTSKLKPEIDKKVVLCLERLGRKADLRRELRQRSGVKRTAADVGPDETILAEYDDTVFTNSDLARELEALPDTARNHLNTGEAKMEFLRNVLAHRLLVDKAMRLELDRDPDIEAKLAEQRDVLVVQKLIDDWMKEQPKPTAEDVERFYKAESDRFKTAGADEAPPFEQVKERAAHMLRMERDQERLSQLIDRTLEERNVTLHADRLQQDEEEAAE
jgi:tetratricopeptide (TPR) repeat protein